MGTWRCLTFAIELPPFGERIQLSACVPHSGRSSWLLHIRRGRQSASNQQNATTVNRRWSRGKKSLPATVAPAATKCGRSGGTMLWWKALWLLRAGPGKAAPLPSSTDTPSWVLRSCIMFLRSWTFPRWSTQNIRTTRSSRKRSIP